MAKFRVRDYLTGKIVVIDAASKKEVRGISSKVTTLEEQMAEALYKPMAIESFAVSPDSAEYGMTVNEITFSWKLNKTPASLTLDGSTVDPSKSGTTITDAGVTEKKTYTLKAVDERGTAVTKTASITFKRAVYYGVGAARDSYDDTFFGTLKTEWRTDKKPTITVSPNQQHVYYCLPVSFGTCSFALGVLPGGFELASTVLHTNVHGATEQYYVYRSVELLNMTDMVWSIT